MTIKHTTSTSNWQYGQQFTFVLFPSSELLTLGSMGTVWFNVPLDTF